MNADDLSEVWRSWYEERAAILEYECPMPRWQAEHEALRMTVREMHRALNIRKL